MKRLLLPDILLTANRKQLLDSITAVFGYNGTCMEQILHLYVENVIHEISTREEPLEHTQQLIGIYSFRPHPKLNIFKRDEVREYLATGMPPLFQCALTDMEQIDQQHASLILQSSPLIPTEQTFDFSQISRIPIYIPDGGSLLGVAIVLLEEILLNRGFQPLFDQEEALNAFLNEPDDEFFWLSDGDDETEPADTQLSTIEKAQEILLLHRYLRELYPLLE